MVKIIKGYNISFIFLGWKVILKILESLLAIFNGNSGFNLKVLTLLELIILIRINWVKFKEV